jgi:regulator of sirC expression with transglutaminase-like and TPR domain
VDHLRHILGDDPPAPSGSRLDRAALELACIQFPGLDPGPCLNQLTDFASQLGDRLRNFNDGRDFVEKAQRYLFGELGFHGNEAAFFDPRNSCLNQVLERRIGIPITLSIVYMEVARRLQMPVFGISLPRRFVVQFDDGRYATYIDPFGGGQPISARECFALAGSTVADPALLERASHKQILMRMLHNLQHAYWQAADFERAAAALNLLLIGAPGESAWYKLRGVAGLKCKRYQAARQDLEKYLRLEPHAPDRDAVSQQLEAIHRWLAQVN